MSGEILDLGPAESPEPKNEEIVSVPDGLSSEDVETYQSLTPSMRDIFDSFPPEDLPRALNGERQVKALRDRPKGRTEVDAKVDTEVDFDLQEVAMPDPRAAEARAQDEFYVYAQARRREHAEQGLPPPVFLGDGRDIEPWAGHKGSEDQESPVPIIEFGDADDMLRQTGGLISPEYAEEWAEGVRTSRNPKMQESAALMVAHARGATADELRRMFERQGHSGWSASVIENGIRRYYNDSELIEILTTGQQPPDSKDVRSGSEQG